MREVMEKEIINRDVSKIKKEEFLDIIEKAGTISCMACCTYLRHFRKNSIKIAVCRQGFYILNMAGS